MKLILLLVAITLAAQQPTSFEAASIRPNETSESPYHFNIYPSRLDAKHMGLRFLIADAFDLPDFQLSGPAFLQSRQFDIIATTATPVSRSTMHELLHNLLVERFHLATHWDTRTEEIYRLEVLPTGAKMATLETGYAGANSPMRDGDTVRLWGPMSMPQLAQSLMHFTGKPVLDSTGLGGFFKIDLRFASEDLTVNANTSGTAPFLRNALPEQLGLRLVPLKESVKYLVIDHADEVPTEN